KKKKKKPTSQCAQTLRFPPSLIRPPPCVGKGPFFPFVSGARLARISRNISGFCYAYRTPQFDIRNIFSSLACGSAKASWRNTIPLKKRGKMETKNSKKFATFA
ncbi:hypothetical protein PgNI_10332, partial [Pyricularia grisea]|uniref:Uncharacterized protein n=1 Tax=Pyricularia grisea TaxID=148305 RepID=A0A6P8AYP1_PYRGI